MRIPFAPAALRSAFLAAFVFVAAAASAAPPAATLRLDVTADHVTISGVTPRSTAVIFAVMRIPHPTWREFARRDYVLRDDDGDGTVTLTGVPVPAVSVWSAIDTSNGACGIATPPGYDLRRIDLPGQGLKRGIDGQLSRISAAHGFLEGLVVRAGTGAWAFMVADGGPSDADANVDGRVEFESQRMRPLGSSPAPPKHLLPKDTVILVDPFTLEVFSNEVTQ